MDRICQLLGPSTKQTRSWIFTKRTGWNFHQAIYLDGTTISYNSGQSGNFKTSDTTAAGHSKKAKLTIEAHRRGRWDNWIRTQLIERQHVFLLTHKFSHFLYFVFKSSRYNMAQIQQQQQQQQQQHSLFSQASWGRLEMKPERKKKGTDRQLIKASVYNPRKSLFGWVCL